MTGIELRDFQLTFYKLKEISLVLILMKERTSQEESSFIQIGLGAAGPQALPLISFR